jgi:hypothetical protein
MNETTKRKKFNPIVTYEAVSATESNDALNKAYRILFNEMRRDEIKNKKASNSHKTVETQAEKLSSVSL